MIYKVRRQDNGAYTKHFELIADARALKEKRIMIEAVERFAMTAIKRAANVFHVGAYPIPAVVESYIIALSTTAGIGCIHP